MHSGAHHGDGSEDESPTSTLDGTNETHDGVTRSVGGLHGQMPPSNREPFDKDHQAGTIGGDTGPQYAENARHDLGLTTSHNEKASHVDGQIAPDPYRKIERTATGTDVAHHAYTGAGQDTVQGVGMVPITRPTSRPPAVSPFGGVAPEGIDQMEGLRAVRSHEEEEEREAIRKEKGPDPWLVRFDEGEPANPKVKRHILGIADK